MASVSSRIVRGGVSHGSQDSIPWKRIPSTIRSQVAAPHGASSIRAAARVRISSEINTSPAGKTSISDTACSDR